MHARLTLCLCEWTPEAAKTLLCQLVGTQTSSIAFSRRTCSVDRLSHSNMVLPIVMAATPGGGHRLV